MEMHLYNALGLEKIRRRPWLDKKNNHVVFVYSVFLNPRGLQSANAFVRFTNDGVDGDGDGDVDERTAILDHFGLENARDHHKLEMPWLG
ncbi:hypothetical protein SASPL_101629 [Salvia splendens]|uniref:Uncharacterized protein n=1 Tax=Salvia splendens TaxID=180675 RepID=A0A8X9ABD9_SALSN|nr:hypothetical protein SASPL_101629 [Salvia splendens]